MLIMKINIVQNIQTISFKAGKTVFLTDYDGTFKPKILKYPPKTYEEIANPYYAQFCSFQKQGDDIFDIYITTGRHQNAQKQSCIKILDDFKLLEKSNRPFIKGIIENNGGNFFDIRKQDGNDILVINSKYNKQREEFHLKKNKKNLGQKIKKDLDAMIEVKKAKKNNDLVIVAGDGNNDKSFLNIFTYIKLPKGMKIPQDIENAKKMLKNNDVKKQIDDLPLKILTVEGDITNDKYYKYLVETFPNKYKHVKQETISNKNSLFNSIKECIENYKNENKYFKKSLNKKIFKKKLIKVGLIILPITVLMGTILSLYFYFIKNQKSLKQSPKVLV